MSLLVAMPKAVPPLAETLVRKIAEAPPVAVPFTRRAINPAMQRLLLDTFEFAWRSSNIV